MRYWTGLRDWTGSRDWAGLIGAFAAGMCLCVVPTAAAEPSVPVPAPGQVPARTAISVRSVVPGLAWGTANESESVSALSLAKLYLIDYALRHGDASAGDKDLGERMIRYSDNAAADAIDAKYPHAIDEIAAEYGLTATHGAAEWGNSSTSTADVSEFLVAKLRSDPDSPILTWMREPGEVAADGTRQDWGTARLPRVQGTKWGWSDTGVPEVSSASFGPGFAVTAHTYGTPEQQTEDVLGAVNTMLDEMVPAPGRELLHVIPGLRLDSFSFTIVV